MRSRLTNGSNFVVASTSTARHGLHVAGEAGKNRRYGGRRPMATHSDQATKKCTSGRLAQPEAEVGAEECSGSLNLTPESEVRWQPRLRHDKVVARWVKRDKAGLGGSSADGNLFRVACSPLHIPLTAGILAFDRSRDRFCAVCGARPRRGVFVGPGGTEGGICFRLCCDAAPVSEVTRRRQSSEAA